MNVMRTQMIGPMWLSVLILAGTLLTAVAPKAVAEPVDWSELLAPQGPPATRTPSVPTLSPPLQPTYGNASHNNPSAPATPTAARLPAELEETHRPAVAKATPPLRPTYHSEQHVNPPAPATPTAAPPTAPQQQSERGKTTKPGGLPRQAPQREFPWSEEGEELGWRGAAPVVCERATSC